MFMSETPGYLIVSGRKGSRKRGWLDRFSDLLPKRAKVLDIGCGAGEPIAQYLISQGSK